MLCVLIFSRAFMIIIIYKSVQRAPNNPNTKNFENFRTGRTVRTIKILKISEQGEQSEHRLSGPNNLTGTDWINSRWNSDNWKTKKPFPCNKITFYFLPNRLNHFARVLHHSGKTFMRHYQFSHADLYFYVKMGNIKNVLKSLSSRAR